MHTISTFLADTTIHIPLSSRFFLFIFSLFRVTIFSQAENITGAHHATVILVLRLIYISPAGTIHIQCTCPSEELKLAVRCFKL